MINNRLTFESHAENLCKKAGQKLHALARIANYMDISKKRSIMNAFILSQFSYCPLIWMFQERKLNHRINKIYEDILRIVYNYHQCLFEELLERDNSMDSAMKQFSESYNQDNDIWEKTTSDDRITLFRLLLKKLFLKLHLQTC